MDQSWTLPRDGGLGVNLPASGNSYNGQEQLESLLVLPNRGSDLSEEFRKGGMVYSEEAHGRSLLHLSTGSDNEVGHLPLLHGLGANMPDCTEADLQNAFLVVITTDKHPVLNYLVMPKAGDDATPEEKWKFSLEESPEWALALDGLEPLTN